VRELNDNYIVNGFPWWGTRQDPATLIAATAATIYPVLFLKLEFDDGDVNLHSRLGNITWGGDTYTGTGTLGQVSNVQEVSDLSLQTLNVTLAGLPTDLIAVLFDEQYQGRTATLYLGYLRDDSNVLIADPMILFRGLIDTADIEQSKTLSIVLSIGSRFAAWDKPIVRHYNNANQQQRYPEDKGLQFIEQTTNKTVIWGAAT